MSDETNLEPLDGRLLRDVFGCFATGVTVVTSVGENGKPVGLVVNSFSSVSLDPPQILWSIGLKSPSRRAFCEHAGFAGKHHGRRLQRGNPALLHALGG